jgi:hypothetical protein
MALKKGKIVRRKSSTGQIGPYRIVTSINRSGYVIATSLVSGIMEMFMKDNLAEISVCKIIISHRVFERIQKGLQVKIIHDPTSTWIRLCEKKPQLIQLRSELYSDRIMIFKIDKIDRLYEASTRKLLVRLELGNKIL